MSDFLDRMAAGSEARWRAAADKVSLDTLRRAALASPRPPVPVVHPAFDLIAEVKLRAPSVGQLASAPVDRDHFVVSQAERYARAGAVAISVLTEPDRFDGCLDDLRAVAQHVRAPIMRKDFLVHPYQVWEARLAGAAGVLLIARMLSDEQLDAMVEACLEAGLFVLLEAFDGHDLARAQGVVDAWPTSGPALWVGVNTRNLATLQVDPNRLAALASGLPAAVPGVAESGLTSPGDAARVRGLGYRMALVGSALMASPDPEGMARQMLQAGRAGA